MANLPNSITTAQINASTKAEADRAKAAESQINAELDQEEIDRKQADDANSAADAAAIQAQAARDSAQDQADASRAAAQSTKDASQDAALTTETQARQSADTAETQARAAADQTNASAISSETTRAKAAEQANTDADTARATAQGTRDTNQDSALSANTAADASRATAQATKDANQDAALAALGPAHFLSGTSVGTSTFTYTFPTAYKTAPYVQGRTTWSGNQMISAYVDPATITTTQCTVIVKRSKGTLLLSDGPFEQAPAGTAFQLLVIGTKVAA